MRGSAGWLHGWRQLTSLRSGPSQEAFSERGAQGVRCFPRERRHHGFRPHGPGFNVVEPHAAELWMPDPDRDGHDQVSAQHVRTGSANKQEAHLTDVGVKSFVSASATLEGIEVANMIRKGQMKPRLRSFAKFAALAA